VIGGEHGHESYVARSRAGDLVHTKLDGVYSGDSIVRRIAIPAIAEARAHRRRARL
jgi:hypothetical protein